MHITAINNVNSCAFFKLLMKYVVETYQKTKTGPPATD